MLLQNTCDCQEFYVKSQNIVNFLSTGESPFVLNLFTGATP
jgi:hypothetical protein